MSLTHYQLNLYSKIRHLNRSISKEAYRSVNTILSQRNWLIGYRIAEEELAGEKRAEYGANIIKKLSKVLTEKYGKSLICLSWSHYRTLLQVYDKTARDCYEKDKDAVEREMQEKHMNINRID